jgi:hypothetical protein
MRRAWVVLIAFVALAFGVEPSQAQFAECSQDYVRTFEVTEGDIPWSPGELECVEYFRFSVSTPHGERWIRGIGDINVGALLTPGAIESVETGARRAAERLRELGDYRIDNTTILMAFAVAHADSDAPLEGSAAAWTEPGQGRESSECRMTAFLLGDYNTDHEIPYMVAHELFHCVQIASLSEAQNATSSGLGLWWIEGSAEVFAAATVGAQDRWNSAAAFDEAVLNEQALFEMSYSASIFFYWRHQHSGLAGLMPFLLQMAGDASAAAQRGAIRAAMSNEELLEFAEAYDDRRIYYPGGGGVRFGTRIDGETWTIDATSTHNRELKPFVITPGWADYACGTWRNRLTPDNLNVEATEESSSTWEAYPAEIDRREGARTRYRTMAMHTGDEDVTLSMRAERRASCTPCLSRTVIDRCLLGTWRQTGGGPMEWLRRQGIPQVTRDNTGALVMTLNENGTFSSQNVGMDFQVTVPGRDGPTTGDGYGAIQGTSGRWSAQDGRLYACFDSGGEAAGTVAVRTPGGGSSSPFAFGSNAGEQGSSSYTCSDAAFTTSSPMPRGGAMEYQFARVTPPPRP